MAEQLTQRQAHVLATIETLIKKNGYSPSVREVADRVKCSASTAHGLIEQLDKKGYITKAATGQRAIRILNSGRIDEIVERCGNLEHYDTDEMSPPQCIDDLSIEEQSEVEDWLNDLLKQCARASINMYLDE